MRLNPNPQKEPPSSVATGTAPSLRLSGRSVTNRARPAAASSFQELSVGHGNQGASTHLAEAKPELEYGYIEGPGRTRAEEGTSTALCSKEFARGRAAVEGFHVELATHWWRGVA